MRNQTDVSVKSILSLKTLTLFYILNSLVKSFWFSWKHTREKNSLLLLEKKTRGRGWKYWFPAERFLSSFQGHEVPWTASLSSRELQAQPVGLAGIALGSECKRLSHSKICLFLHHSTTSKGKVMCTLTRCVVVTSHHITLTRRPTLHCSPFTLLGLA